MRVIAGALRGRRLQAPRGRDTRPTSDRARESLFNLLGPLDGERVLDLFAGSGALGIEALSRGASHAQFVERARPALAAIRANLEALGLEGRARVVAADAGSALAFDGGPWDLVLADPPWAEALEDDIFRRAAGELTAEGRLVLEHPATRPVPPGTEGLRPWKTRRYGDTGITIYAAVGQG